MSSPASGHQEENVYVVMHGNHGKETKDAEKQEKEEESHYGNRHTHTYTHTHTHISATKLSNFFFSLQLTVIVSFR